MTDNYHDATHVTMTGEHEAAKFGPIRIDDNDDDAARADDESSA